MSRPIVPCDCSSPAHCLEACDREAERHPSSQSSAPMVRHIKAMARLRAVLDGCAQ